VQLSWTQLGSWTLSAVSTCHRDCGERLFAGASVAGSVSKWTEAGGKCHFCPQPHKMSYLPVNSLRTAFLRPCLAAHAALALLCSQGAKAPSMPQRGECEMASDRHLLELHTSKWVKAAAKSSITVCLFSLYFQGKIRKKLRI